MNAIPTADNTPPSVAELSAAPLPPTAGDALRADDITAPIVAPLARGGDRVDPLAADRAAISSTLDIYRQAYNALDAVTVSTIWQGLDTSALRRAFSTLTSQELSFDHCDVKIADDQARASCSGVLNYVPRIGPNDTRQRRLSWTIDLQRTRDRWLIENVSAR